MLDKMSENPFIKPEMMAEIEKQTEETRDGLSSYINLLTTPLWVTAFWAIIAAVVTFTGNIMLGGDAKFKLLFAVTCWTGFIDLLRALARTLLTLMNGNPEIATSLAIVLSPDDKKSFLFTLLNRFDFFSMWLMIVYAIGISVIYKFSVQKSAVMVFGLWALWSAIFLFLNKLTGGMFTFV